MGSGRIEQSAVRIFNCRLSLHSLGREGKITMQEEVGRGFVAIERGNLR